LIIKKLTGRGGEKCVILWEDVGKCVIEAL